ncbi:NAD(P)-dependent alcohol dehydrogenase [Bradyrhizobium sp. AUGA SZCCT0431]|uniref:zinc-dependent alcohol dehydrogenase family protein n=1 Tax=Bradyrhizobium sp. AUGA SZCCT0431 TaxID=2807674 RepID=UPI001BAACB13|nr:NAD(P)-dependent alcohol dehydrogenase [Bradyrhizobium sp. AUGA SZCCT0431]MBR1143938.1 NAD(P)-dependent alcohol dehydrogenase [Bradyrhizobium sp. AUGA SZCCT0431]
MKVWQVAREWSIDAMELVDRPEPEPGPGQVVVRMRAASLNYRDLITVQGQGGAYRLPLIPFSDGAGEIVAVGPGVSRVSVGNRVCPMFFQSWFDGGPSASGRRLALGGTRPGVLQELLLLDAEGVTRIPDHLTFVEAATLPCAALTAWRALFDEAQLRPGQTVLVQGTGGVSIFALQFAKLAGATVIVTSSSDEKLERAKALGADHTINYRAVAEWGKAAADWAGGGVDHIVEVGGKDTFRQSLEAARVGGTILVIGVLSGISQQISIPTLFSKNLHVIGLSVGSRRMFENMASAIGQNRMNPVIDRTLGFTEVPDALRLMQQAGHFGKITIAFP